MTAKPRVFVSSVVEGFGEYRLAARRGIEAAGAEAVLVNEDFPALSTSSRNACLDAIDSCDVYVAIVGERGGWTAPSGALVVEEEYERARRRKLPILAFLQRVTRDEGAARFAQTLSDYVDGLFRPTFETSAELRGHVERALAPLLENLQYPSMSTDAITVYLTSPPQLQYQAGVRLVVAPERQEEVIDPLRLDAHEFVGRLMQLAHAPEVGLFNYAYGKTPRLNGSALVIHQEARNGRGPVEDTRIELTSSGVVVVDGNVSGRIERAELHSMSDYTVLHDDVRGVLRPAFRFVSALYIELDAFKRHQRFFYNLVLHGLGYRTFAAAPLGSPGGGIAMNMNGERPLIAYDAPRVITRADLKDPASEVDRAITMLARQARM